MVDSCDDHCHDNLDDAYHESCDDHGQATCEFPAKCTVHFLAESIGNCCFRLGETINKLHFCIVTDVVIIFVIGGVSNMVMRVPMIIDMEIVIAIVM